MQDRNKWAFWTFTLAAAALICIPSTLLLQALGRYRRFAEGVDPSALRPTPVRWVPREAPRGTLEAPKLGFVEFKLKAPKARRVDLVGDFNGWRQGTLEMVKKKGGPWDLLLPLPKGRYRYLFVVDGSTVADPSAPAEDQAGRLASLKVVQ